MSHILHMTCIPEELRKADLKGNFISLMTSEYDEHRARGQESIFLKEIIEQAVDVVEAPDEDIEKLRNYADRVDEADYPEIFIWSVDA